MKNASDFAVDNHGTIIVFHLFTDRAREWVNENVNIPSYMRLGGDFACEHRMAEGILEGMAEEGLVQS